MDSSSTYTWPKPWFPVVGRAGHLSSPVFVTSLVASTARTMVNPMLKASDTASQAITGHRRSCRSSVENPTGTREDNRTVPGVTADLVHNLLPTVAV